MFQVFSGVSYACLQVFYLDVAYVCNDFQMFFQAISQVFQMLVSSVSSIFFCMLQLLHLDALKIDRVLHMECVCKAAGSVDDVRGGMGDVRGGAGPYRCAFSRARRARRSLAPYAGSIRTSGR
jgi:hypothetical protein